MLPVIAIIGRPNVGKSTLFNCLTRSRQAIVADLPGVTRDRHYGKAEFEGRDYMVIDTGGLEESHEHIQQQLNQQVWQAIDEADHVFWLLDARTGVTGPEQGFAQQLRKHQNKITLVINKTDGVDIDQAMSDFYSLGFGELQPIAATHRRGIDKLLAQTFAHFPPAELIEEAASDCIRISIVGRPNVGKSTLTNRLLGEDRVIVADLPGTTRDAISIDFKRGEQAYQLIDTAGIRRKNKVDPGVERYSVIRAMQSIEACDVVVFVLDGQETISEQDARLLDFVVESGRALVLAVNKWDGLDHYQRQQIEVALDKRLPFLDYVEQLKISALHGTGVGLLWQAIGKAYLGSRKHLNTAELTRVLETALARHQPPLIKGKRVKLRYAHPGGTQPPTIIIHGKNGDLLPADYQRYLNRCFRKVLKAHGSPIRIFFRDKG